MFTIFKKKPKEIQVWVTLYALEHGVVKTTFTDLGTGKYQWNIMGSIVYAEDEGVWWFRNELEAIDDLLRIKNNAIKPLEEQITQIKRIPLTPVEW